MNHEGSQLGKANSEGKNSKKSGENHNWLDFGLTNKDGEFNCFVNVILQALWNSESMKRQLI